MQIDDNYSPFTEEIIFLENKYLTGTFTSLADAKIIVAHEENKLLGYLYYSLVLDEAEIISICVNEAARRQGLATKLFAYLIQKGVNICYLDVKQSNLSAISLYKKLGFKEYGKRQSYYSDNSDAILMKWSR